MFHYYTLHPQVLYHTSHPSITQTYVVSTRNNTILTSYRHQEALPSLYASTTLILTSLPLAQAFFAGCLCPNVSLLRSLQLSLCVPYTTLHYHKYESSPSSQLLWAELCTALSNLYRLGSLRDVVLRLDLADDNRFWWEVYETWALSPIDEMLRRGMVLQLPEITGNVPRMQEYQFAPSNYPGLAPDKPSSSCPASPWSVSASSPGSGDHDDDQTTSTPQDREQDDMGLAAVGRDNNNNKKRSPGDQNRTPSDFKRLDRYPRRRWAVEGGRGDGVQPRLEFFNPREHALQDAETRLVKMRGLFRGMLIF